MANINTEYGYFGNLEDLKKNEIVELKKEYDLSIANLNNKTNEIVSSQETFVKQVLTHIETIENRINKIQKHLSLPWYKRLFRKFIY